MNKINKRPKPIRYQGKITAWNDARGFGFIAPNGGGAPVFVHVKSFAAGARRPADGAIVTYELVFDPRGQPQADQSAFVRSRAAGTGSAPLFLGTGMAALLVLAFMALLAILVRAEKLPAPILAAYLGMSVLTFLFYWSDKAAARQRVWRTSESTLLILGLAGGWPGALMAQRILRHKSRKPSFQAAYQVTVAANCLLLGWLAWAG